MDWREFLIKNFYSHIKPGSRILEIGTGFLSNLEILLDSVGFRAFVWSLDPNEYTLKNARMFFRKHFEKGYLRLVKGVAENLPFEDNYFDLVVSTMTFHHLKDVRAGVSEGYRVTKKDGIFVILDWNESGSLYTPHSEEMLRKSMNEVIENMRSLFKENLTVYRSDVWYAVWGKK